MKVGASIVPILLAACALTSCERSPEKAAVTVEEAWIRLPAAPGRPGAAYFTLRSDGPSPTLAGVSSPQAERIELHETRTEENIARMVPVSKLQFPEDGELRFAPGGRHAMLFGLDPALKPGDRISLSFTFEPPMQVAADAEVRGPGGGSHAGH
jgi:periplasmic copper chaperone A